MHSKANANIFQLAREIEQQSQQAQKLAKNIANAYRNVQQLKITKPATIANKEIAVKSKWQSSYANKIKETLKQLNANKAKEVQLLKNVQIQKMHSLTQKPFNSQETKLKRTAAMKLCKLVQMKEVNFVREGFTILATINKDEGFKESQFIRKWKLNRLFNAWRDEVILIKISKQRIAKENQKKQKQSMYIAIQFRKYSILKKCFKEWIHEIKKERKRKIYELEIRKQQLEEKMRKEQQNIKRPSKQQPQISQNSQLQGKLRGFLDGLKDKIQNKDRLKTIKQKTQQSQLRIRQQQSQKQINASEQLRQESNRQDQQNQLGSINELPANEQNVREPYDEKKPLNSEQLEKKRKELQNKYKNRKENLQKLKKMKEQKKKQEQRQVLQLERQIQLEQKKVKQQQYRQFIKNKQMQQEWQKKQKILMQKAEEFNQKRLIKYYGWNALLKAKQLKIVHCTQIKAALLKIILRVNFVVLTQEMKEISDRKLELEYSKMQSIHRRKLFKKCLLGFKSELIEQKQLKQELIIRHQVNTLKIALKQWKSIIPTLRIQNFEWERPRNKKAQIFRNFNLMQKGLQSLKQHKNQEQRERNIEEHKKKIKNKIQNMLQESSQVNYAQFL